uniref:RRM domain-containing protein n=1 Tax=Pyrodinium bahamense TaxID=73915 RepID=A0A7S0AMJ7_9DINO
MAEYRQVAQRHNQLMKTFRQLCMPGMESVPRSEAMPTAARLFDETIQLDEHFTKYWDQLQSSIQLLLQSAGPFAHQLARLVEEKVTQHECFLKCFKQLLSELQGVMQKESSIPQHLAKSLGTRHHTAAHSAPPPPPITHQPLREPRRVESEAQGASFQQMTPMVAQREEHSFPPLPSRWQPAHSPQPWQHAEPSVAHQQHPAPEELPSLPISPQRRSAHATQPQWQAAQIAARFQQHLAPEAESCPVWPATQSQDCCGTTSQTSGSQPLSDTPRCAQPSPAGPSFSVFVRGRCEAPPPFTRTSGFAHRTHDALPSQAPWTCAPAALPKQQKPSVPVRPYQGQHPTVGPQRQLTSRPQPPVAPEAPPLPMALLSWESPSEPVEELGDDYGLPPGTTTLVVRNISARYTQEDILKVWEPDGSYDFISLPFSITEKRPLGFAFINFTSYEDALVFKARWHGQRLVGKRRLHVSAAAVQGYHANLLRVGPRLLEIIANDSFLPATFCGTERLETRREVQAALDTASEDERAAAGAVHPHGG